MVSSNEFDVIDGWIQKAITRLDESRNEKINLKLNKEVVGMLLSLDMEDRPEYFLGARDTLIKTIKWRAGRSHPNYEVTWSKDTDAANDESDDEDGELVLTRNSDAKVEAKQPSVHQSGTRVVVTTEAVRKFLADSDGDSHELPGTNSMNDEQPDEAAQTLKKQAGS